MAYHFTDNVHTKCFTPREYQVELLDAAKERNIIVCLGTSSAKIFIATKLIQELANSVRRPWSEGGKRTLYVVDTAALATQQASYIRHLTDLNVAEYTSMDEDEIWDIEFWDYEISLNQVLVMTSEVCLHVLQCQFLQMSEVNLLVLDECHRALREHPMRQIMEFVSPCIQCPRILGLTAPLLNSSCDPSRLEGELRRLEMTLHSTAETASDIVSVLRYCSKPIELVVECAPHTPSTLDETLEQVIMGAREFLDDHRYDPSELYEDEFLEELQGIPDPKIDPQSILSDFLDVLHTLGAWCADKAALALLIHLEKLKVKIPYERHFLLLCMVSSVMIRIRAICDDHFQSFGEKDRIYKFSSPKVLRLLEILRHFKPEKQITSAIAPITEGSSQGNVHLEVEEGSYRDPENVSGNTAIVKNTSENETTSKDVAKDSYNASEDKVIINNVDKDSRDIFKYKTIVTDVDQCLDSSDPNLSNNKEAILGKEIVEEAKGSVETVVHELDVNIEQNTSATISGAKLKTCLCHDYLEANMVGKQICVGSIVEGTLLDKPCTQIRKLDYFNGVKTKDLNVSLIQGSDIQKHEDYTNFNKATAQVDSRTIIDDICKVNRNGLSNGIIRAVNNTEKENIIKKFVKNAHNGIVLFRDRDELFGSNLQIEEINPKSETPCKSVNKLEEFANFRYNNYVVGDGILKIVSPQTIIDTNSNGDIVNFNDMVDTSEDLALVGLQNCQNLTPGVGKEKVNGEHFCRNCDKQARSSDITLVPVDAKANISSFNKTRNHTNSSCRNKTNLYLSREENESAYKACIVCSQTDSKILLCNGISSKLNEYKKLVNGISSELGDICTLNLDESTTLSTPSCDPILACPVTESKYNNCDNSRDDCNCSDSIFNSDYDDDPHNSSNSNIIVTKGAKILENMNSGTSLETTTKPTEIKGATNLNQQYLVKSEATKMVVSPVAEGENNNITSSPLRGRPHRWSRFNRRGFTREDGKIGARGEQGNRPPRNYQDDADTLCCIVFAKHRFTAKILYSMLNDVRHHDDDLSYLCPQFTVDKIADPAVDLREAESEHRKQEEVLKRFRMRECNLLVATSVLEEGMDLPKCNLVVRFDLPTGYRSYAQSKGRARAADSHYVLVTEEGNRETFLRQLAEYREIEEMLVRKCANQEPPEHEEKDADIYTGSVEPYRPANSSTSASVNLATAVALVNRYCAKLPSDTFTRLTPLWSLRSIVHEDRTLYSCSLQLPINSPVKQDITGGAVPSRVLARRVAALEACRVLHQAKELDDNLLPIGKESFRLQGEEDSTLALEELEEMVPRDSLEPRPGTTKRRQYYYKRIAEALTDCRPTPGRPSYLYHIGMVLTCPLPEEQNTRGRRIYPPEDFPQGFGILTLKPIPPICPFPIFTRSGEVRVGLELSGAYVVLDEEQLEKIMTFLNYTFTSVLRLQKYLMMFDPDSSENCFFIVPTIKRTKESEACVDWEFLDRIYDNRNLTPCPVKEEERAGFVFDSSRYHDAVIMPWYRNQDQPHYFYVAEICAHLTPKSTFPGSEYKTFDEYYFKKYGIQISNSRQPLLDVDHTSARLNFLTPRYVNRKGEALPTSSEETKRAKRESLEQKQILVPELCTVHPFPASLWRKAVCLPCILYRVNALLLADQIRRQVARSISLGTQELTPGFKWSPLNFGWSLADVLRKSKETRKAASEAKSEKTADPTEEAQRLDTAPIKPEEVERPEKTANDIVAEEESKISEDWMEIGTWSNDMAADALEVDEFDPESCALPSNVTLLGGKDRVRYGSPTSWLGFEPDVDGFDSGDDSSDCAGGDYDRSDSSDVKGPSGLRIEFKGDVAEAVEDDAKSRDEKNSSDSSGTQDDIPWDWEVEDNLHDGEKITEKYALQFHNACEKNLLLIKESGMLVRSHEPLMIHRKTKNGGQGSVSPTETLELADAPPLPLLILPATSEDNSDSGVCIDLEEPEASSDPGNYEDEQEDSVTMFSFDAQPDLEGHPGPSPAIILQALTMSNANDGINLERLETIGDSFLKYAITTYLYCTYDTIHEGKLSHLRSKQVSNLNLYRLGRRKVFGESMIATKFEPHDNWLPPCYYVPKELEQALIEAGVPASHWNQADLPALRQLSREEICRLVKERSEELNPNTAPGGTPLSLESLPCFIPYNLLTQHSIPDKSVADCVEALIGAYLISCGPRGALLFMAWLGICVLPRHDVDGQVTYGSLKAPKSPLLYNVPNPECQLKSLLNGYDAFERRIGYRFRDRSYLLQSLTHASYSPNRLTDCYQRLEFLGDAVLDYLITRHLYEDTRQHSPGALTDLRSSLVNNTIFASLAVRYSFHKYFRHLSPGLSEVVDRFVRIQEENGHTISEEYYLIEEEECEEAEDVEVPKALGDVFESVAGAIFLDSNMSLDAVWRVYFRMMKAEIEQFSTNVPKSPIRELLELEPETAKFGKPEKLADGRRVRVTVEVFGKGTFKGIGRNYRIAKCTAAKCALKQLKKKGLLSRKQ